ncbi:11382_t:CDS:1, partial [Paraglomus occultum]
EHPKKHDSKDLSTGSTFELLPKQQTSTTPKLPDSHPVLHQRQLHLT